MEYKEAITDNEIKNVKVLFECNHIDDLAAYDMVKNNIKITPENAPVSNFKLMLVENPDSPYGFISYCYVKRSDEGYKWKYMGFGDSGASSIVTALLKQLKRKEQELSNEKQAAQIEIDNLNQACLDLKQAWEEREQQCEELKAFTDQLLRPVVLEGEPDPETINKLDLYKQALENIKTLIEAALGPEQTPEDKTSMDALCMALDIANGVLNDKRSNDAK